jgi:hypothetical protein
MGRRIIDVTAETTLACLPATAHGLNWVDGTTAVVDVGPAVDGSAVRLELELDPADLEHLGPHAETIRLTPAQARRLATALGEAAAGVPDS